MRERREIGIGKEKGIKSIHLGEIGGKELFSDWICFLYLVNLVTDPLLEPGRPARHRLVLAVHLDRVQLVQLHLELLFLCWYFPPSILLPLRSLR